MMLSAVCAKSVAAAPAGAAANPTRTRRPAMPLPLQRTIRRSPLKRTLPSVPLPQIKSANLASQQAVKQKPYRTRSIACADMHGIHSPDPRTLPMKEADGAPDSIERSTFGGLGLAWGGRRLRAGIRRVHRRRRAGRAVRRGRALALSRNPRVCEPRLPPPRGAGAGPAGRLDRIRARARVLDRRRLLLDARLHRRR